ncbi:MAG: D-arabinono-1,4-lactone oxidase [Acidimicrobiales bacterium]
MASSASDGHRWTNWAGNQVCAPVAVDHPATEEELVASIRRAAADGQRVKVVGSGHSFTGTALTDGRQIVLDRYHRLLSVDPHSGLVTVQAGITLRRLNAELARHDLAMPNLGDVAYQTISGALATATHGTGISHGNLSTQIRGMRLITGDGSVVSCSADEEPEVFAAARVGLGALGVVSTVTLQCVPAFDLHAVEAPERIDPLLADIDTHVEGNDHFELYWVPHTGWALTKRNNRTDLPRSRRPVWRELYEDVVVSNLAFGALCRLGRLRPQAIPRLMRALPSTGPTDYVDRSDRVFTSPRLVRFYEMEYAVPREAGPEALNRVRELVRRSGLRLSFPVEVRFVAGDDIALSPAFGRETCYIAVHVYQGMDFHQYFSGVESIMDDYGGRPHWGKLHFQTAETLEPRYPEWSRFQAVRARLDPDGRFANEYLDQVLGPVTG